MIDRILFTQKLLFAPSILNSRLEFEIPFDLVRIVSIMALDTTLFTPGVRSGSSLLGNFAGCDLVECSVHHPPEALALTKALVNVTE